MSTDDKQAGQENIAQTVHRIVQDREIAHEVSDNVVAVPEHWRLEDLERYLDAPRRNKLDLTVTTAEGFAAYVQAYAITGRTAVYVDRRSARAVIDDIDRANNAPAWRDHKATLALDLTPEWAAWTEQSGQTTGQRLFADWIQDRAAEIMSPPLADLVQELRHISADSNGRRRDSATHLSQSTERVGSTTISNKLPEYLELRLPILKCEPDIMTQVQARLYVKLADDGVYFIVQLVNEQVIIDRRIRELVERLRGQVGDGVPVYF